MIRTYANRDGRFAMMGEDLSGLDEAVWVDLLRPTKDEEIAIERALDIDVPTLEEMSEALRVGHLGRLRAVLQDAKDKRDQLLARCGSWQHPPEDQALSPAP